MRTQDRENDLAELMPRILSRENMLTAWQAVKRNGGAPGIDRMTVETLPTWLRARPRPPCWPGGIVPNP